MQIIVMWTYLKELTNLKEQKGGTKTVQINGIIYENDQEIAENLNKFFVKSVKEINESIEQYEYRGLYTDINNEMDQLQFKMASSHEIYERN